MDTLFITDVNRTFLRAAAVPAGTADSAY